MLGPLSWHRHSHDSSPAKWLWDFPQSLRSNKLHSVQSQLCGGPHHQWKKSEQAWLAGAEPTGMPASLAEAAGSRSVPESLQQYFSSFHICSALDVTWVCVCVCERETWGVCVCVCVHVRTHARTRMTSARLQELSQAPETESAMCFSGLLFLSPYYVSLM